MAEGKEGGAPPQPKETSRGLPFVSPDTIIYVQETYAERLGEYLQEVKTRLINENPHLGGIIDLQLTNYPDELHPPIIHIVTLTIAILEEQAMANKKR